MLKRAVQAAALPAASPWNNDRQEQSQMQNSRIYTCDLAWARLEASCCSQPPLASGSLSIPSILITTIWLPCFFSFSQVHLHSCCNRSYPINSAQILGTICNYPLVVLKNHISVHTKSANILQLLWFFIKKMMVPENMLQWSHIPCLQGNQECKKKIWLCYIYQSTRIHLPLCLPHLNGGNRRQGNWRSPVPFL